MTASFGDRAREVWRTAREQNRKPEPTRRQFDPSSWAGAAVVIAVLIAALWVLQIVNATDGYGLNRFGLRPREAGGLWGIVTQPLFATGYAQLLRVSVSVAVVGWAVLIGGLRNWLLSTAVIVVLGGAAGWLVGPAGLIVGASSLVFGWIGYLIARAYFARRLAWILIAVVVLFGFGTLLSSVVPGSGGHRPWAVYLSGLLAGVLAGAVLHPPRRNARRRDRRDRRRAAGPPVS